MMLELIQGLNALGLGFAGVFKIFNCRSFPSIFKEVELLQTDIFILVSQIDQLLLLPRSGLRTLVSAGALTASHHILRIRIH